MLHLNVPETTRLYEPNGSWHDAFKIHINGAFHCTLRYSNLLKLHESLCKTYNDHELKFDFPPKKIKYLMSEKELEERRDMLEGYLRFLSQNHHIANSQLVSTFFREAQKETFLSENQDEINTQLTIYSPDGTKACVHCTPGDSSSLILERLHEKLDVPNYIIRHFGLFIVTKSSTNPYKVLRWLQEFECPSISLHYASKSSGKKPLKIILRRNYWDIELDKQLCLDRSASKLLYSQALAESDMWKNSENLEGKENHWSPLAEGFWLKLKLLQEEHKVLEIIKLCQLQSRYGLLYFEECTSDYPMKSTKIKLAVGNRQLFILYQINDAGPFVESSFRVNRIRCWKLLNNKDKNGAVAKLSFEYLMARDHLQWITVYSDQSVLLSLCLQSMVDEIVKSLQTQNIHSVASSSSLVKKWPEKTSSNGSSDSAYLASPNVSLESFSSLNTTPSPLTTIKTYRSKSISSSSFDNDAFNTITDEDL